MATCVLVLAMWSLQASGGAVTPVSPPLELTIDDAVAVAVDRSFQVQRSERDQRIAQERTRAARGAMGPRLDLSLGADQAQRYYEFNGNYDYSVATPQFATTAGVSASYDFDISGVRRRSLEQTRLAQQSGSIDAEQTILNTAVDARLSYMQALRAQQQVEVDEQYLFLLDRLIANARSRQASVVDFLMTERSNSALILDQSRQAADLAISSLRQQLRLETDRPLRLTSRPTAALAVPSFARLVEIASAHRSDLRQSEIRLRQARLAQIQASDFRRPSLRASAFANHTLTGETFISHGKGLGRTRSAGIGLSFNLPLWSYDGGALDSARRIAAIQAEQALADSEEAKERAGNEISAELIAIDRDRARMERTPDSAQARQSLDRAEEQMLAASPKDATALLAQISNARQNWRASLTLKYDALTAYYAEYFRLQRSLGTDLAR
ncbi:MAG TPA: TolC family protein [Sphingomicrobium sp.]